MNKTNKNWIKEHIADTYVKKAQLDGYRSRAAYKLIEINRKYKLFKKNMKVIDLGSAPGGWSQVAAELVGNSGKIFSVDLLDMTPIKNTEFIQGDFSDTEILMELEKKISNLDIDLVISDMAPNISGIKTVDQSRAIYLNELVLDFSVNWLKPNGSMLVKSFVGADFDNYIKTIKTLFKRVIRIKPDASRSRSSEIFILGHEKLE